MTLRSTSQQASKEEVQVCKITSSLAYLLCARSQLICPTFKQGVYESMMSSFRYEECYKALRGRSEPYEPDVNFRDLLLAQIGHIHRRDQSYDSKLLLVDLEKYVDDSRRHQNEKYMMLEDSNLNREAEAAAVPDPPLESSPFPIRFQL